MPTRSWPALLLLVAFACLLRAQSTNPSLNGRITDAGKGVIVGANVVAVSAGMNIRYQATTNAEGQYYLPNLPPGLYRIEIEKSGFKKFTPRLILVTNLAGNPTWGRSQGVTAPSSVELSLFFDLEKIFGLKGGSIFASFSERWGHKLSTKHIGNTFSTQQIFGFQTWRVIDVSYQQKLFDDPVEFRLGRFAAMDDFLVSPYNFGVMQNAFCGNPFGTLLNAPGMSAYYGTWAALGKVKPTRRSYVMTGIYNGDPKVRENKYHGVNLSLKGPLFAITEAGYQINGLPGDSQRLGNYKLNAWDDHSRTRTLCWRDSRLRT